MGMPSVWFREGNLRRVNTVALLTYRHMTHGLLTHMPPPPMTQTIRVRPVSKGGLRSEDDANTLGSPHSYITPQAW